MLYYQGGYYLLQSRPIEFGSIKGKNLWTASACLNESYLDAWSYSWAGQEQKLAICEKYGWSPAQLVALEQWVDQQLEAGHLGWVNVFQNLATAKAYKALFFEQEEVLCLGISFAASQQQALIQHCGPSSKLEGEIGLRQFLSQAIPENPAGKFLGYDLIGVEIDGSFHSLHCHDLQPILEEKFNLSFNDYGLIEEAANWQAVLEYCNDEQEAGLEPVPWFYVKVKLYE